MKKYRDTATRTVNTPNGSRVRITATAAAGGAYVDLSFNGGPVVELINVWIHEDACSEFQGGTTQLGAILEEWINDQEEWPEFAEVYAAQ